MIMEGKKLTEKDLPSGMLCYYLMYWLTEQATKEQRNLPPAESVDAFLKECQHGEMPLNEQEKQFMIANGYSLTPNGRVTM